MVAAVSNLDFAVRLSRDAVEISRIPGGQNNKGAGMHRVFSRNRSRRRSVANAVRSATAMLAVVAPFTAAHAQHANDDPVAAANDAFGLTLGLESIGLYGPGGIRG